MSKPLGAKNYGSIPHLPNSRLGSGDHCCHEGQARIATVKTRDKYDRVIVQEKLDGSNVGIARINGGIYPLVRSGYVADTSPYEQHWKFAAWVYENQQRFLDCLNDGERLVGEWLLQAHGTRYELPHEPFVVFDLMTGPKRAVYDDLLERAKTGGFVTPHLLHTGESFSVEQAIEALSDYGYHGALDQVEGAVWRVERNKLIGKGKRRWTVDFLVKFVRPDKMDGCYLPEVSGKDVYWNKYRSEQ